MIAIWTENGAGMRAHIAAGVDPHAEAARICNGNEYALYPDNEAPAEITSVTPDMVKAEAYRRIIAIVPEWKQRNLTARAAVLAAKTRLVWTQAETDEWNAGEAIWMQVKAVRDASDLIEADDPIPTTYQTDPRWP